MKTKLTTACFLTVAMIVASLTGCESSRPITVGVLKSGEQIRDNSSRQSSEEFQNRGMTMQNSQMQ